MKQVNGGVCAPKGFLAGAVYAGIRKNPDKKDLALIYSKEPCVCAGVTTQNLTVAAPVIVTREHINIGNAQAIICNSGNANACTTNGMEVSNEMCSYTADALSLKPSQILVASTGVIGKTMDVEPVKRAMGNLVNSLSENGGEDCANAIMTTDTMKKEIAVTMEIDGKNVTIGGISKGSGMIHPNMATMLGFITTDVSITQELLQKAVEDATSLSFNMISVDGDTSTNDMALVLANGLAGNKTISKTDESYKAFYSGLLEVFIYLAVSIARDGEGASKLLICSVQGGKTPEDTKTLARSVVKSSLFKAAMFGEDANWGRVLCAMGYSGADFEPEDVSIKFVSDGGEVVVCQNGMGLKFDEELALSILKKKEITIDIVAGKGQYSATAWGCDLTYDYVKINGDYRS